jgi:hypothetical protein
MAYGKNRNVWVFADARRQHRILTITNLVVEEYNLLKSINRYCNRHKWGSRRPHRERVGF